MKEESSLKYIVAGVIALVLAVTVWWQLSDLLCPPRGCRPRRDFLVNFFLVWMPAFLTFFLTIGFIMMIWEKFERPAAETGASAAPAHSAAGETAQAHAAYDRGYASVQRGDLPDALRQFDAAVRLDPANPQAFMARGTVCVRLNQFEHAIADYDRVVALDPGNAEAYYNRGVSWHRLGDVDRTLADFDAAIRLRPDDVQMLRTRGVVLQSIGENAHAIADFRQALALANDDATRQELLSKLAALGAYP